MLQSGNFLPMTACFYLLIKAGCRHSHIHSYIHMYMYIYITPLFGSEVQVVALESHLHIHNVQQRRTHAQSSLNRNIVSESQRSESIINMMPLQQTKLISLLISHVGVASIRTHTLTHIYLYRPPLPARHSISQSPDNIIVILSATASATVAAASRFLETYSISIE